jgi:hypothetical protein
MSRETIFEGLPMARVYVDFNEIVDGGGVMLSKEDSKPDAGGNMVAFTEGKAIGVYMEDVDASGSRDDLIADGTSELNPYYGSKQKGWGSNVKWILKIDSRGIRNQSEERE